MTVIAWVMTVALGLMSALAAHYRDQRDQLVMWIVDNHPKDLE